jgi:hypothetical protein
MLSYLENSAIKQNTLSKPLTKKFIMVKKLVFLIWSSRIKIKKFIF